MLSIKCLNFSLKKLRDPWLWVLVLFLTLFSKKRGNLKKCQFNFSKQMLFFKSQACDWFLFSLLPRSLQPGHRPFPKLFQALRKHLSDRPSFLQAGDQDGLRKVHRRDVCERTVQTERGQIAAEVKLVPNGTKMLERLPLHLMEQVFFFF